MLHSYEKRKEAASAWHSEVSADEVPNLGSILYAKRFPGRVATPAGRACTAAYDGLSDAMKKFLGGLTAIHESEHVFSRIKGAVANYPTAEHPVIRTHPETGR